MFFPKRFTNLFQKSYYRAFFITAGTGVAIGGGILYLDTNSEQRFKNGMVLFGEIIFFRLRHFSRQNISALHMPMTKFERI